MIVVAGPAIPIQQYESNHRPEQSLLAPGFHDRNMLHISVSRNDLGNRSIYLMDRQEAGSCEGRGHLLEIDPGISSDLIAAVA